MTALLAARDLVAAARHDRLPWLTLVAAVIAVLLARVAGDLAIGASTRIAVDVALLAHWVVLCGSALRLGVHVPSARWAAVVVAGPMSRVVWIGARLCAVALFLGAQAGVLASSAWISGLPPELVFPAASGLVIEACIWAGATAFAAIWVRPWAAAAAAAGLGFVGHLQAEYAGSLATWDLEPLASVVWLALPGLDLVRVVGHGPPTLALLAVVHGVGWTLALTAAAAASMHHRDLG